jgi:hypothetical protein
MVAAGEGCLIDLDLRLNGLLAILRVVRLPDGGVVLVSWTHIGGDHKNKQLNTGVLGGSSDQRLAIWLPIADARWYLRRCYNSPVGRALATLADLARAHIAVLELFQQRLEQAQHAAHASKVANVQSWKKVFTAKETFPAQLMRRLANVTEGDWVPLDDRREQAAREEQERQERKRAREEKQIQERHAQQQNEERLREGGARRSTRLAVRTVVCPRSLTHVRTGAAQPGHR